MNIEKGKFFKNIPGLLLNNSFLIFFGDSPDVAIANACVAATELVRRRGNRDDVTITPGKTFLNELSVVSRVL